MLLPCFWFIILHPCISWSENGHLQRAQHPAQSDGTVENVVPSSNNTEAQLVTKTHTESSASHTACSDSRQPLSSLPPSSSLPAQVCDLCAGNAVLTLSVFWTVSHLLLSLSLASLIYHVFLVYHVSLYIYILVMSIYILPHSIACLQCILVFF